MSYVRYIELGILQKLKREMLSIYIQSACTFIYTCVSGFMGYQSLIALRRAVEGDWQAITSGAGKPHQSLEKVPAEKLEEL